MSAAVVIPARNEGATVGAVAAVARAAGLPVVVVDDASSDRTSDAALAAGASVLRLSRSSGKGSAMAAGLAQVPAAQVVLFLDADLSGLRPDHVRALLAPVVGGAGQSIGVLDGAPGGLRGGQRAVRASIARAAGLARVGWGDEAALNIATRRAGASTVPVRLAGVKHPIQERKRGFAAGVATHLRQAWDIAGVALGPGMSVDALSVSTPGVIFAQAPGAYGMAQSGLTFEAQVVGPTSMLDVQALWDTGSQITSVDRSLLQQIGATPTGSVPVSTVQGTSAIATYQVALNVDGYPLSAGPLTVLGDDLPWPGPRVLVGRDVGSLYVLTANGPAGVWSVVGGGAPTRVASGSGASAIAALLAGVGIVATLVLLQDVQRTG